MASTPEVEFFYDCSSPWTYFAFTRILPLMERLALPIRWRPILVGGVFNAVNQELYAAREAMFTGGNNRRLNYYLKDMQDWARFCGVRVVVPAAHRRRDRGRPVAHHHRPHPGPGGPAPWP